MVCADNNCSDKGGEKMHFLEKSLISRLVPPSLRVSFHYLFELSFWPWNMAMTHPWIQMWSHWIICSPKNLRHQIDLLQRQGKKLQSVQHFDYHPRVETSQCHLRWSHLGYYIFATSIQESKQIFTWIYEDYLWHLHVICCPENI